MPQWALGERGKRQEHGSRALLPSSPILMRLQSYKLSLRYGCVKRPVTHGRSHLKQAAANCGVAERYECMLSCQFVRLFFPFPRHSGPARQHRVPRFSRKMPTGSPETRQWEKKIAQSRRCWPVACCCLENKFGGEEAACSWHASQRPPLQPRLGADWRFLCSGAIWKPMQLQPSAT